MTLSWTFINLQKKTSGIKEHGTKCSKAIKSRIASTLIQKPVRWHITPGMDIFISWINDSYDRSFLRVFAVYGVRNSPRFEWSTNKPMVATQQVNFQTQNINKNWWYNKFRTVGNQQNYKGENQVTMFHQMVQKLKLIAEIEWRIICNEQPWSQ